MQKDRGILYLTPPTGAFLVGLVLGERALKEPKQAIALLSLWLPSRPPRVCGGRGIRLPVLHAPSLRHAQAPYPFQNAFSITPRARKSVANRGAPNPDSSGLLADARVRSRLEV